MVSLLRSRWLMKMLSQPATVAVLDVVYYDDSTKWRRNKLNPVICTLSLFLLYDYVMN